jgi:predicted ATPase
MTSARLLSLEIERFKCFEQKTRIDLAPLTVIVGRNNSGKSTLIQALLLLDQTLKHPRRTVPLNLEGPVDALNLRELTYGWPESDDFVLGPQISVKWSSQIDVEQALEDAWQPDRAHLAKWTGIKWIADPTYPKTCDVKTEMNLTTHEQGGIPTITSINLSSEVEEQVIETHFLKGINGWFLEWYKGQYNREFCEKIKVELEHFLPYLSIDRSKLAARDRQRAFYNGFGLLFAQPLSALAALFSNFRHLSSIREQASPLFRASTSPPEDLGISGEYAAQLLQARKDDVVHYLPPLRIESKGNVWVPTKIRARSFKDAINDVLQGVGVDASIDVEDIPNVGFRLLVGRASLVHVGRGLTYLLPIIELGLFADPLRFKGELGDQPLSEYLQSCQRKCTHLTFEEPEAHLHPKVQSRLAHWFVSLAMANRQLIVETHSDHLVRRLRGLMARAPAGSELEQWLRENVVILEVDQDQSGRSTIKTTRLSKEGGFDEHWPDDFMDEASDEESAIYYAALDKKDVEAEDGTSIQHDAGPEPELETEP